MRSFRLSEPAKRDIARLLRRSLDLHGPAARTRYRACLTAALRRVAADPHGPATIERASLAEGLRSFHLRHSRLDSREAPVAAPVHVLYYRLRRPDAVEIVRVLHERMDAARQFELMTPDR